jgi:hypothetical protein
VEIDEPSVPRHYNIPAAMIWHLSHRADQRARVIADRHYNRQKIGSPQFVPPGRCLVLYAKERSGEAFWVTSWPFAQYVKHAWAGAWMCTAFRNENAGLATTLILDAVAATRYVYGDAPPLGMVSFIDPEHVQPIKVRGQKTWGRTWRRAGFREVGKTKAGLLAFQLLPQDMPPARAMLIEIDYLPYLPKRPA